MTTERDTKFAGFAGLEAEEICCYLHFANVDKETIEIVKPYIQTFLAQRAYDLACHVTGDIGGWGPEAATIFVNDIPDLTEWPKQES